MVQRLLRELREKEAVETGRRALLIRRPDIFAGSRRPSSARPAIEGQGPVRGPAGPGGGRPSDSHADSPTPRRAYVYPVTLRLRHPPSQHTAPTRHAAASNNPHTGEGRP